MHTCGFSVCRMLFPPRIDPMIPHLVFLVELWIFDMNHLKWNSMVGALDLPYFWDMKKVLLIRFLLLLVWPGSKTVGGIATYAQCACWKSWKDAFRRPSGWGSYGRAGEGSMVRLAKNLQAMIWFSYTVKMNESIVGTMVQDFDSIRSWQSQLQHVSQTKYANFDLLTWDTCMYHVCTICNIIDMKTKNRVEQSPYVFGCLSSWYRASKPCGNLHGRQRWRPRIRTNFTWI